MSDIAHQYLKDKQRVARNFGRAARDYDAVAQLQQTVCARLVERLEVVRMQPRAFADLGSGTGGLCRALRGRYPQSSAIELDISHAMLHAARPRWPWQRRRRAWICADAESLPLRDSCVDLVGSNLMLQWCNDPLHALKEMARVLRPGGMLLLSTLGPATLQELRASWSRVDERVHVNAFMDIHALGNALAAGGFADMVLESERFTLTYADGRALMRDLQRLGTGNANAGRPRSLTGKDRFARVLQYYEEFRSDGRLPATYDLIYAHAWRAEPMQRPLRGAISIPVSAIGRR